MWARRAKEEHDVFAETLRDRGVTVHLRARSFPAGSMGPKVEAVCRFVEATGAMAAIGRLGDASALLNGTAGTTVVRE
jgi:carbamate kinase